MIRSALVLVLLIGHTTTHADDIDKLKVGVQPDGSIVVPTNQVLRPAGTQITFPGRPVDLAFADEGKTLVVKNKNDLVFIDTATNKIKQTLTLPNKAGFSVVGLAVQGDKVFASDAGSAVRVAERKLDGQYQWSKNLSLAKPADGKEAHPAGIWLSFGGASLFVTSTRGNNVQVFDTATAMIDQVIDVGVAPYMIAHADGGMFVTNWGGDRPGPTDPRAISSGTPIRIDPFTGVSNHGSVKNLTPSKTGWLSGKSISVGLHPSGSVVSPNKNFIYVANANSDTVSVIDGVKRTVVETIPCRPESRLPFGSGCNALALSPSGKTLYVANGTNNCIAVVSLGALAVEKPGDRPEKSRLRGLIPTGWYPGAILMSRDGKTMYVANVKGHGSLSRPRAIEKGMNSHDHLGSISVIPVPDTNQLAAYTAQVNRNNRLAYSLAGLQKPRASAKPVPIPQRHGEPSVFKHVIYIVKENRTYDQVFGDMKEGNGDSALTLFGERVTPNHHALAREFTLFDNFYCSGVLSADGHTWVNEAYVSDYLEKAFGGFTRSYPDDGSDPLAYIAPGFLWSNALAHKKTLRNYGEYVKNEYPKNATWTDFYNDYKTGTFKLKAVATANIKTLQPHTHAGYPWFPLIMPDVYRAKLFIDELKEFEKKGEFPNLVYLTLPCDHTDGTKPGYPTPRAMVADNDLALSQIVEAVTKSKFWKDTCIFVVEDDPQDGFDHVDAHRTVALAISPHSKRKYVDSTCYNQTGMVKSIELILGLPPMNQLDLSATPMRNCFQATPDLTPYTAKQNQIALDEMNPPLKDLKGAALDWANKSLALNLDEGDAADEDALNRILWFSVHGDKPYPDKFAGPKTE